jgi:hypothetical protein
MSLVINSFPDLFPYFQHGATQTPLLGKVSLSRYTVNKENRMPQIETMTLDEKLAIECKAAELSKAGDREEYIRLMKTAPLPPYLAKI